MSYVAYGPLLDLRVNIFDGHEVNEWESRIMHIAGAAIEFSFHRLAHSVLLVQTRTIDIPCYSYMDSERIILSRNGQEFPAHLASQTTQHLGSEELPYGFVVVATILQDDI